MKRETEIKDLLINNAIHLIANGGFEAATVKEITKSGGDLSDVKMNDVYIYRIFGGKEELYKAVFARLDSELFYHFRKAMEIAFLDDSLKTSKQRILRFFENVWDFIMGNEANCRCYVRFYYSVYFSGDSQRAHQDLFDGLVSKIAPFFIEEADVDAISHSVFSAMLAFAIRSYNNELLNDEENRPHIFNVLFCMTASYLKPEPESILE